MAGILEKRYQDEDAAREHLEKIQWPEGPICPHCGIIGEAFKLQGRTTRKGLWKCSACREPFTVTIGTIFEDSKIPLHKWLLAIHLMCSSKKGISAHQLWRNLWGVDETGKQQGSYRTAWFMAHRIRWALGQEPLASKLAGIIEIDETFIGGKMRVGPQADKPGERPKDRLHHRANKAPVFSILQREDAGNRGLYGGMGTADVKAHKKLPPSEDLLDNIGRLELSAHEFRASVTEHRLNRDGVSTERRAIETHRAVGEEVRQIIVKENGVRPENLPTEPSIKRLVQKHRRTVRASKADNDTPLLS